MQWNDAADDDDDAGSRRHDLQLQLKEAHVAAGRAASARAAAHGPWCVLMAGVPCGCQWQDVNRVAVVQQLRCCRDLQRRAPARTNG